MDEHTKQLIDDARTTYQGTVVGKDSRILRGKALRDLFEQSAEACRADLDGSERQLGERINELAMAKVLADDKGLRGPITYEPSMLPSGRRIDFVADRGRDNVYIEVKTVHPEIADSERSWADYVKRRKLHPANADFITHKDWMGGQIYGNTFASRSRFLEYTMDFRGTPGRGEENQGRPGPIGILWKRSPLATIEPGRLCGLLSCSETPAGRSFRANGKASHRNGRSQAAAQRRQFRRDP
jgi:hypothetical protein